MQSRATIARRELLRRQSMSPIHGALILLRMWARPVQVQSQAVKQSNDRDLRLNHGGAAVAHESPAMAPKPSPTQTMRARERRNDAGFQLSANPGKRTPATRNRSAISTVFRQIKMKSKEIKLRARQPMGAA